MIFCRIDTMMIQESLQCSPNSLLRDMQFIFAKVYIRQTNMSTMIEFRSRNPASLKPA